MNSTSWLFAPDSQARFAAGDLIKTYAERMAVEELERAEHRRLRLAEQKSELNSAEVRVQAWEKLHGLRLPSDPHHAVLEVIASDTGLTLAEIREEQRVRRERSPKRAVARDPYHGGR